MLADNGLADIKLSIRQNDTDIKSEILNEINNFDNNISEKDIAISKLRQELDSYKVSDSTLIQEVKSFIMPSVIFLTEKSSNIRGQTAQDGSLLYFIPVSMLIGVSSRNGCKKGFMRKI